MSWRNPNVPPPNPGCIYCGTSAGLRTVNVVPAGKVTMCDACATSKLGIPSAATIAARAADERLKIGETVAMKRDCFFSKHLGEVGTITNSASRGRIVIKWPDATVTVERPQDVNRLEKKDA